VNVIYGNISQSYHLNPTVSYHSYHVPLFYTRLAAVDISSLRKDGPAGKESEEDQPPPHFFIPNNPSAPSETKSLLDMNKKDSEDEDQTESVRKRP
jgi:hypothetical protein